MVVKIVKKQEKKISFGKIAYQNKDSRRINEFVVTICMIDYSDGSKCFSAMGGIWNASKTDYKICGQMLDIPELLQLEKNNKLFAEIKRLWKTYHLNAFNAGTQEQSKALAEEYERTGIKLDFDQQCDFLKSKGLYEVQHNGKPYRYGSDWIKNPIPQQDLDKIYALINS